MIENLLFTGTVRHRRFHPKIHQFSYNLFMFCFNTALPTEAFKGIKHISLEKLNWFSFHRKNYLNQPELALDESARQLVNTKFGVYPTGKIYLLTHLTCLGYCFNPISLYFIFDEHHQQLNYLILEVTNTPWGERHNYVLANSDKSEKGIYRYQFQKKLHVSPFLTMNYRYQLNLKITSQKIIIHMENYKDEIKDFDATLTLDAVKSDLYSIKKVFWRYPLITYKLTAAIYWQALKLWVKGIPVHAHPKTDKKDIINDKK